MPVFWRSVLVRRNEQSGTHEVIGVVVGTVVCVGVEGAGVGGVEDFGYAGTPGAWEGRLVRLN